MKFDDDMHVYDEHYDNRYGFFEIQIPLYLVVKKIHLCLKSKERDIVCSYTIIANNLIDEFNVAFYTLPIMSPFWSTLYMLVYCMI